MFMKTLLDIDLQSHMMRNLADVILFFHDRKIIIWIPANNSIGPPILYLQCSRDSLKIQSSKNQIYYIQ